MITAPVEEQIHTCLLHQHHQASTRHLRKSRYTLACCVRSVLHALRDCSMQPACHNAGQQATKAGCAHTNMRTKSSLVCTVKGTCHMKAMQSWLAQSASLCRTVRLLCDPTPDLEYLGQQAIQIRQIWLGDAFSVFTSILLTMSTGEVAVW